jgi:hypothetical protein
MNEADPGQFRKTKHLTPRLCDQNCQNEILLLFPVTEFDMLSTCGISREFHILVRCRVEDTL